MGGPLTGCGRPSKAGQGRNRSFRNPTPKRRQRLPPQCRLHVATAGSGQDPDNPRNASGELNDHPGSGVGGGIDKSVLAISEPRRIRDKGAP